MALSHIKPHGALYGMAARSEEVAAAVAAAVKVFGVPVLGMAGTQHETVYGAAGVTFISEYYADLDYDDDGNLIITREHHAVDPDAAAARARRAIEEGKVASVNGRDVPVRARVDLRPLRHAQRRRRGARGESGDRRPSRLSPSTEP